MKIKKLDFDEIVREMTPVVPEVPLPDLSDLELEVLAEKPISGFTKNNTLLFASIGLGIGILGTTLYFLVRQYRENKMKEKELDKEIKIYDKFFKDD